MAHARKLLRAAAVTLLVSADTAAGTRVHATRVDPFKKNALPAIAVYILNEEVDLESSEGTAPRELKRIANMEIVGFVGGATEAEVADAMDDLAEEIEAAMDDDPYIGATAGESILKETDIEIQAGDGHSDPLIGIATLTYSVTYRTSPAAPADLDDFLRVEATHEIVGGVEDTVPAEDQFTVQETP